MTDLDDQGRIDALIDTFFSCFDNRDGAVPESSRIADCFTDKAVIVRHSKAETSIYTPLEFALPRIELLTGGTLRDFHEHETSSRTSIFGGIAVRTSRYSKSGMLDGGNYFGAGTKCFQLVELADGWRIISLAWIDDDT